MKGIFAVAILVIGMVTTNVADAHDRTPVRSIARGVVCKVACDKPVRSAVASTVKRSRCTVKGVVGRTRGVMQRSRSRFGSMVRGCCK